MSTQARNCIRSLTIKAAALLLTASLCCLSACRPASPTPSGSEGSALGSGTTQQNPTGPSNNEESTDSSGSTGRPEIPAASINNNSSSGVGSSNNGVGGGSSPTPQGGGATQTSSKAPQGTAANPPAASKNFSHVTGIFVAPELTSNESAAEWKNSLKNMADIGITTIIIQYSYQADSVNGNQAYFPYSQPDTAAGASSYPARRSQVESILAAAKMQNMKVYLGLQLAEREWFDQNGFESTDWLTRQYQLSASLADSLWNAYGKTYAGTIAGWYLPFEFESTTEYHSYFPQITKSYYAPVTAYLKKLSNLPVMISPLMYAYDDKTAWQNNLITVLSGSQIDIIAPQDGIGFGTQTHSTVGDWFRVCQNAVRSVNSSAGKSVRLWGNCENYVRLRNPNEPLKVERLKPMAIDKFIDSLNIAAPYVENLITFSIHRWDTAYSYNQSIGVNISYYDAYKRYYQADGVLSASKSDGYYVHIQPTGSGQLTFSAYASAGLTDGFASSTDWSQFKGISSPNQERFTMEIRFDDPIVISKISSHYYQDSGSGIALPKSVKYEYLVRSGSQDEVFTYTDIGSGAPSGTDALVLSSASAASRVQADGVRITVTPGGEWTFLDDIWVQ